MGATNLIGNTPMALELMTTTGRVLRISAPRVGSRFTNQISPRLASFINKISCLPFLAFYCCSFVVCYHLFGLLCQYLMPLVQLHPHEFKLRRRR
ncbi:hypothetical protein THIOM_004393 [Candidatus Thiomargarita nelsonii]|uniref:Uncharacterized protein n=1 Tax=Candidatus Thiomargarita nelsonii TaxID=1003181 RepID=A0A176RVZ6_9GAMM|nr:hypothetical protein THIOM_004393 [Candidatus Thiomargarita nelsonii]